MKTIYIFIISFIFFNSSANAFRIFAPGDEQIINTLKKIEITTDFSNNYESKYPKDIVIDFLKIVYPSSKNFAEDVIKWKVKNKSRTSALIVAMGEDYEVEFPIDIEDEKIYIEPQYIKFHSATRTLNWLQFFNEAYMPKIPKYNNEYEKLINQYIEAIEVF